MKLDPDCIRAVLLELEKMPYGEKVAVADLVSQLHSFSEDEVQYACMKLFEEGFIDAVGGGQSLSGSPGRVKDIYDITYRGHELLNNVRSHSVWARVRDAAKKVGGVSLGVLANVANSVAVELLQSSLGHK